MHLESRPVALFTFFGSLALLSFVSCLAGGFNFSEHPPLVGCITTTVFATLVYFLSFACAEHYLRKRNRRPFFGLTLKQNIGFFYFFILPAMEEVFARWFCLGVLPQWLFFCGLFFGNALWVFYSDSNFYNFPSHPLLLLPRFLVGFFYAYVFLRYGLLASYMVHLGAQSLLMTLHKVEDDNAGHEKDVRMGALALGYVIVSVAGLSFLRNKIIWDVGAWVQKVEAIEKWQPFDYLIASVGVIYLLKAALLFLCFDHGCVSRNGKAVAPPAPIFVFAGCLGLMSIAITGYWLLVAASVQLKALLMASVVCAFNSPSSGSARVSNFWFVLVAVFMAFCVVDLVPWYWAIACLALHGMLYVPFVVLERRYV